MSFDVRSLVVGLIVALAGIAIPILWPTKRWIGWVCLASAAGLLLWWIFQETKSPLMLIGNKHRYSSTALVGLCGALLFSLIWWVFVLGTKTATAPENGTAKNTTTAKNPEMPPTMLSAPTPVDRPIAENYPPATKNAPSSGVEFGNLKERATTLAKAILDDYKLNFGTPKDGGEAWTQAMHVTSNMFRGHYERRVFDIVQEFAALHIRDQELEDDMLQVGIIEQLKEKGQAEGKKNNEIPDILPQTIKDIAARLQVLAKQI